MTYLDTYDVDIGDVTTLSHECRRKSTNSKQLLSPYALMERAKNTLRFVPRFKRVTATWMI